MKCTVKYNGGKFYFTSLFLFLVLRVRARWLRMLNFVIFSITKHRNRNYEQENGLGWLHMLNLYNFLYHKSYIGIGVMNKRIVTQDGGTWSWDCASLTTWANRYWNASYLKMSCLIADLSPSLWNNFDGNVAITLAQWILTGRLEN